MTYPGYTNADATIVRGTPFVGGTDFVGGIAAGIDFAPGVDISDQPVSGAKFYAVTLVPSTVTATSFAGVRSGQTYAAMTQLDSGTVSGTSGTWAWAVWERTGDETETLYRHGWDLSPAMLSTAQYAIAVVLQYGGTDPPLTDDWTAQAYPSVGGLTITLPDHTAGSEIYDQAAAVVGHRVSTSTAKVTADPPYADADLGLGVNGFSTFGPAFYTYSGNVRDDPGSGSAVDDAYYHRDPFTTGQTATATTVNIDVAVALVTSGTGPERPVVVIPGRWRVGHAGIGTGPW